MRLIFTALAATCLTTAPVLAQDARRMDEVIRVTADGGKEFSGSVLVALDGRVLLDRGYGLANREWNIPNDGETRFRIASLTKQFTAVAIMLLSERGKVDLDAPIRTYLADTPPGWDGITVRHLLSHTAGIPDFTDFPTYSQMRPQPATVASLIALFRDKPQDFQPGERWSYSNSGYVLLTAIIEKASGKSYPDFIDENIFHPLGMTQSGYDSRALIPHRAAGYTPTAQGIVNADPIDMTVPQGAGGLYSTTRDLLKWEQGLYAGRLLRPLSLRTLTTAVKDDYAFGLFVKRAGGATSFSHTGGIEGFNTYMAYDPDRKIAVIVLGNLNGPAPSKLGESLLTLSRGQAVVLPSERKAIALPADALNAYAGSYAFSPNFALTLRIEGGKLMAQASGQQALELFPEGADSFFYRAVDAQISFTRDSSGAIKGLVLHQGGRDLPAVRE